MVHTKVMLMGVLAGFVVLVLIYGAFNVQPSTGKVSASYVNFSTFSQIVGFIVVILTILALRYEIKPKKTVH